MSSQIKRRYVEINGQHISVTEEVYYEYYRAVWREAKQKDKRKKHESSFETLELSGVEFADDSESVEDAVVDKLFKKNLHRAIDGLTAEERKLIYALFFMGKTEREYSKETGISKTTLHDRKNRILQRLKELLKNN